MSEDYFKSKLVDTPVGFGATCKDRTAWNDLKRMITPGQLDQIVKNSDVRKFPSWDDSIYREYSSNGQRERADYMMRWRNLVLFSVALRECYDYNGTYLANLESLITQVANQPTWSLSAHDKTLVYFNANKFFLDLGSVETARYLGQIYYMLYDKLKPATRTLIATRVNERIFSLMDKGFNDANWDVKKILIPTNWNSVGMNGIAFATLTIADKNRRAKYYGMIGQYYLEYLKSFTSDGFASEGPSYFDYGFSRFFALREFFLLNTRNDLDIFTRDSRIPRIATFPFRMAMGLNLYAPFGDSRGDKVDPGLLALIANWYHGIALPADATPVDDISRLMFWQKRLIPNTKVMAVQLRTRDFFATSGILVSRQFISGWGKGISLSVKSLGNIVDSASAGENAHSHNDIGSYALSFNAVLMGGDVGGPKTYQARSFGPTRYLSPLMNSYGHPVPVVAGQTQINASDVVRSQRTPLVMSTLFTDTLDKITINLAPAYRVASLTRLTRAITFDRVRTRINITDAVAYSSPQTFETAFTTTFSNVTFARNNPWAGIILDAKTPHRLYFKISPSNGRRWDLKVNAVQMQDYDVKFWRIGASYNGPITSGDINFEFCINAPC